MMEFRPYIKNKEGPGRISEFCIECKKPWSEKIKHYAKEKCMNCYKRLNNRELGKKPSYKRKAKEYREKNREIYNKKSLEHYYNNKEKRIRVMIDYQNNKDKKKKCEECSSIKDLEIHHLDYSKDSKIKILCRTCHRRKHRI